MIFTRHAVERYREFHMLGRPTATDEDARVALEYAADSAIKSGRTHRGDPIWQIQALGIEVVAKHEGGVDICVTVLPPPRFRGLTPLQAEAVADSLARAEIAVAQVKAEVAATPPAKAKPKATTMVARREQQEALAKAADLKKRYQGVLAERDVLCATLKTMRHQLDREMNDSELRAALRIALRYIRASNDAGACQVIDRISAIDPGLVSDEFVYRDPGRG